VTVFIGVRQSWTELKACRHPQADDDIGRGVAETRVDGGADVEGPDVLDDTDAGPDVGASPVGAFGEQLDAETTAAQGSLSQHTPSPSVLLRCEAGIVEPAGIEVQPVGAVTDGHGE